MLQERPDMVASSCVPISQAAGGSGQVITNCTFWDSLVINIPSQESAGTFRGWARRKLLTGFSFPELVIGNLICTKHIRSNALH